MAILRRLRACSHWLAGRRNGVSAFDLARFVSTPTCVVKARRQIESVSDAGEHLAVRLRGVDRPLYWPKGLGMYPLYMVVAETREVDDWHYYEVPETQVVAADVIADCGGAEGIFTLYAARHARHVHLFEPSPVWAPALARTFSNATNVTVIPAALGAAPGEAFLAGGALDSAVSSGPTAGTAEVRVEVRTLDQHFADRRRPLTYLKADLEGYELEMLAGAERTIGEYRPKIAITTYHKAEHAEQIARFVRGVEPRYEIRTKGIDADTGSPVMLHAWVPR